MWRPGQPKPVGAPGPVAPVAAPAEAAAPAPSRLSAKTASMRFMARAAVPNKEATSGGAPTAPAGGAGTSSFLSATAAARALAGSKRRRSAVLDPVSLVFAADGGEDAGSGATTALGADTGAVIGGRRSFRGSNKRLESVVAAVMRRRRGEATVSTGVGGAFAALVGESDSDSRGSGGGGGDGESDDGGGSGSDSEGGGERSSKRARHTGPMPTSLRDLAGMVARAGGGGGGGRGRGGGAAARGSHGGGRGRR